MTQMTTRQYYAMATLNDYKGKTVDVLCSQYDTGIAKDFLKSKVLRTTAATLRSLEKKGLIKVDYFWRGARVTVL